MKTGLIQPLHMAYLPNFRTLAERFQKPLYDNPDENGGKKYSIPYDWGTTGIGVRIDMIKEPITKWADLWNPNYKGRINMLNDQRELLMSALIMLGCKENCTATRRSSIRRPRSASSRSRSCVPTIRST